MNKKISNAKIVNIRETRSITLEGADPKTVKTVLRAAYQGKVFNLGEDKHKAVIEGGSIKKMTSHSMSRNAHRHALENLEILMNNSLFVRSERPEKETSKFDSYKQYVVFFDDGTEHVARITEGIKGRDVMYDIIVSDITKEALLRELNRRPKPEFSELLSNLDDNKLVSVLQGK